MELRRLFKVVQCVFLIAAWLPRNACSDQAGARPGPGLFGSGAFTPSAGWWLSLLTLVVLAGLGFCLLARQRLRSPDAPSRLFRHVSGLGLCCALLAAPGLMLAFSRSAGMPFGSDWSFYLAGEAVLQTPGFFAVQVMSCCLAVIAACASIAGPIGFTGRLLLGFLLSSIILPVFLHWTRGDAIFGNATAFLANLGFIDLGGAVVIHAMAGWAALAALLVIGRQGEAGFPVDAVSVVSEAADDDGNLPIRSIAAALLLLVTWTGVTGASAIALGIPAAPVIANSLLAAAAGIGMASAISLYRRRRFCLKTIAAGLPGGVIAVAAGAHLFGPAAALAVGALGAAAAIAGNAFVERRLNVSDPLGVVGMHAFAGSAGALLLPLFVSADGLPAGGMLMQLQVQTVGTGIAFYWAFGLTYIVFRLFGRRLVAGRSSSEHLAAGLPVRSGSEEAERLAALGKATFEAIMIHRNGIVVDGNDELAKLVGRRLHDLVGRSIFEFLRDGRAISVPEIIKLNDDASHEISILLPDGEEVPVAARGRDITFLGEKARVGCFVDLRERLQAEKRIRHLAQHDPLTGLPNRVLFTERLREVMTETTTGADGRRRSCGVVIIDFDRFKDINDLHGHQAGDAVIIEVAARFSALAGPHDIVARLGGDEFAAILGQAATEAELEAFGSRVLAAIDIRPDEQVNVTVSIGAALYPAHAGEIDALIGCADIALFHAKASGRNAFRLFRPGMNDLIDKRRALEADLEQALHKGQLELYLQPRVNVADLSISGYEALLRWSHPTRGMVSPADFIPVAEASGKIIQLGEWVLAEAVRLLDRIEGHISVNVSPLQFRHSDFVANLAQLLKRSGADPRRIELEITESVLIDDDSRAVQILNELKRMGFAIALDDFGTGYSSLSYLSRYPFDTIKIDRSFVQNLSLADKTRLIVRTIIDLGEGLGMKVVAEGVETIEEALFLSQAGCHELQGYLLGRPVKVAELARHVAPDVVAQLKATSKQPPESRGDGIGKTTALLPEDVYA
jgi:Amt family ammonium transporter